MLIDKILRTKIIYCIIILMFIISTVLSVVLNICVARQALSIVFLTLLPGLLILTILGINSLSITEIIVFSIGLSEIFLMLYGFLYNEISLYFGFLQPLTLKYLIIAFIPPIFIMLFIIYFDKRIQLDKISITRLQNWEKILVCISIILPILSITGINIMNLTKNNLIVIIAFLAIPIYVFLLLLKKESDESKIYPFVIYMVSISLISMWALRSSHLIGIDTHSEYNFFISTLNKGHWSVANNNNYININYASCLSITLLPSIYQLFLHIDPEYLFKILYPLLFSFCPLIIYIITNIYLDNLYSFLSATIYMSFFYFQITTSDARTSLAVLFFAFFVMTLLHPKLSLFIKRLLIILFMLGIIVSHYSSGFIFIFIMLLSFIIEEVLIPILKKDNASINTTISIFMVSLGLIFTFIWYNSINIYPFESGVNFIATSLRSLKNMFINDSRSSFVMSALGSSVKSVPQHFAFIINWIVIIMMLIGIIGTWWYSVIKPKYDLKVRIKNRSFLVIGSVCLTILVIIVAVPFISVGYDMNRIYLQMSVVLTTFFILGFIYIKRLFNLRIVYLPIALVIVLYYISQTGLIYQLYGYPQNIVINSSGEQFEILVITDQEEACDNWINVNTDGAIYTDMGNNTKVTSRGIVAKLDPGLFTNNIPLNKGIFYFIYHTVRDNEIIATAEFKIYPLDYRKIKNINCIYSSGDTELLYNE